MAIFERIYGQLPTPLQNLACCWEGLRIQRTRFGRSFYRALYLAEERDALPLEAIAAFRDRRLKQFISHCGTTVPAYRFLFRDVGIDPDRVSSVEDLHSLPVLSRNDLQGSLSRYVSEAIPRRKRIVVHTSGSTGTGLRFPTTRDGIDQQWATWWRYRRWHGIQPGTWCAYFGGRSIVPIEQMQPPFWRYNTPGSQILFSGYHISDVNLPAYVSELRDRQPPWFHGYPSLLNLLASHLLDRGVDLGYDVKWVTTGAENLLDRQRETIQAAFGVPPRQHYGLAEGVANISECEMGTLHVDEDYAMVEFLPNPQKGGWRLIGTNFTNLALGLLRYDTGDVVELEDRSEGCSCGRHGRIVRHIDGRNEDYVYLPNGVKVGRLDHIFKDLIRVREAQIIQDRVGAVRLRIVAGAGFGSPDEKSLLRETRARLGPETKIEVEYCQSLPRTGRGKLRLVVSKLRADPSNPTGPL